MEVGPISTTTPAVTTTIILSLLQIGPSLTLVLAAVLAISIETMAMQRSGAIIIALRVTGEIIIITMATTTEKEPLNEASNMIYRDQWEYGFVSRNKRLQPKR